MKGFENIMNPAEDIIIGFKKAKHVKITLNKQERNIQKIWDTMEKSTNYRHT